MLHLHELNKTETIFT